MATNCRFAFATHILSVLALHEKGSCSSEVLAATVNTHPVVIRRLLLDLKEAGLIETQRGPGGGAKLSRCPQKITLGQIHRAVAGEIEAFGEHPNPPAQTCCVGREIKGILERVSSRARLAVEREFDAVSLADVLREIQHPLAK
ncbi:transcriptional regulator, BadM/Rrf2 family [Abditibacterium utsteinense]|uniref:Transcriptional regulator, BadM/Rrf2 family n=1 Tax=Abditibacterium utsteinense TaxID=1960156 RepID=A0A2S8SWX8_9BACT|nr:Rrf2 family transcriptional regulator [Abditibacterium utsteinense]PQV65301.1 transcriptional regulator, BadM/Rrf2 family [Abditibacterium utsteinense]